MMVERRATSLDEMRQVLAKVDGGASNRHGMLFKPRPTDVIVSPYAKCGTTWTQQIIHSLRSRGMMDFEEISLAVPWIETALDLGIDLNAEQPGACRAYKSHLSYDDIPKGGRIINVFRNPLDACFSFYKFFENWFFEAGSISLDEFARDFYLDRSDKDGYWHHTASFYRVRKNKDVLLLCYEDMKEDLSSAIQRIATFANIPLDEELRDIVLKHSSLEFMKRHANKFDDGPMRRFMEEAAGILPEGDSIKVRDGAGHSKQSHFSSETVALFDARWQKTLGVEFDLPTYGALRDSIDSHSH